MRQFKVNPHRSVNIFRAAVFLCGDELAAEDLVQDTFLAATESLKRFEERSSLYTWLYGILLNKFRGWLRRQTIPNISLESIWHEDDSTTGEEVFSTQEPGPLEVLEAKEDQDLVRQELRKLPEHHRSVLMLRFVEGMSYDQIANTLGCSIGTVKSRIHYGLKRMGHRLTEETPNPRQA